MGSGPKITVHIQRAFHLSPQQSEVLIPMLLVKLCPNGMKFRAQTAKQATFDPIFDKKFSFSWNEKSKGIQIDLLNSGQNAPDTHMGCIRIMKNEIISRGNLIDKAINSPNQ